MHQRIPTDITELIDLLTPEWDERTAALVASGTPLNLEGDAASSADDQGDATGDSDSSDDDASTDAGFTGGDDNDDTDDDDDNDVEFVRIPKSEYDEQQKKARQQAARARKAENDAKAQKEREAAEQGRFRELSEGYKGERDEAVRERDEARAEYTNLTRRIEVEKVAKRLGFIDTEDAWINIQNMNLADDAWSDASQVEKACKRILRDKSHLAGKARPTGASRKGGGSTLTREEIGRMSETEINTRWTEVQEALASS